MNYYPHHIGDYDKRTKHLSMLEDAAYRRMLDVVYATEKPLPKDQQSIYRLVRARSHAERQSVDVVLGEFWIEGDDGWHNKRVKEELAKAHAKSDAAKASAAMRWHNGRNANASPNAMRTQCEGNAPNNQEPITNNQEIKKPARKRASLPLPDGFGISDRVKAWAEEQGFSELQRHLAHFVGYARATGKTYADWDQALMNAIRDDWAKVRPLAPVVPDYSAVIAGLKD